MARKQSDETRRKISESIKNKHRIGDVYVRCAKCDKFHNGRCR